MNTRHNLRILLLFISLAASTGSFAQGRVVINEYMPWSGCNTTSEFVELLNFGPGPIDIGCYIVTNGTYSVTIPPNTILQQGEFFVLSGEDVLLQNCGNIDSAVQVNLNWTTCNCTNTTIPTTGDGFFKNGGGANEKVVLLDADMNVLDAVTRSLPTSSSVPITTSTIGGNCDLNLLNLGTMTVNYEPTNTSTGINNSFARMSDGNCGWVKTTSISAKAPNKSDSLVSANYQFSTLTAHDCDSSLGRINIEVDGSDTADVFPMIYTLAYDNDSNGIFTETDTYIYGTDSTPTSISINDLPYGRYRMTIASKSGCDLKTFDFFIFNCYGVLLTIKILDFKHEGVTNNKRVFRYKLSHTDKLKKVILEAKEGDSYKSIATENPPFRSTNLRITAPVQHYGNYRLRVVDKSGNSTYSKVIKVSEQTPPEILWPNPVQDKLNLIINATVPGNANYIIYNGNGLVVEQNQVTLNGDKQQICIATDKLKGGIYYLKISGVNMSQPLTFTFVK